MPNIFNIPDEYLQAIGEVVVRWNYLEQIINLILIDLLGEELWDGKSFIVFAHMAFPQKMDVLESLVEEWLQSGKRRELEKYKAVVPALKQAQVTRNTVLHSVWGMKDGQVTKASITARRKLKFSQIPISLEEVKKATQVIEEARHQLSLVVSPQLVKSIAEHKVGKS